MLMPFTHPACMGSSNQWNLLHFAPRVLCCVYFIFLLVSNISTCLWILTACVYLFVRKPGCLRAARATAWPPRWRWVAPPTIAARPATSRVPVTPPEALLTGDRSPCLSSKQEGGEGLLVCGRVCFRWVFHSSSDLLYQNPSVSQTLFCPFFSYFIVHVFYVASNDRNMFVIFN